MSYAQCMKWHRKHPKGGKPQYMGFDAFSSKPIPPKVYCMLVAGSDEWQVIEEMTVDEASAKHPEALRFANFTIFSQFRCDGPAATNTSGRAEQ